MTDRIIAPEAEAGEEFVEQRIRPRRLDEYIGQPTVREQLGLFIEAARARGDALDHVLIFGPPASARPPSPTSLRTRWGRAFASPRGR